jgi:FkbM family methyltransferase
MSTPIRKFSKTKFLYRAYKYRFRDDVSELTYITDSLHKGDFALDVGAHKGGYLHWIMKGVGAKGHAEAFEPQPLLYQYLADMKLAYRYNNLTLNHAGLSSRQGQLQLFIPKAEGLTSPGATFEQRENTQNGHFVDVPVYKLDEHLADRRQAVNLIKMDVEGHELEVFKGALDILTNDRPKLIFECENRHLNNLTVQDIFRYLENLGYKGRFFLNGKIMDVASFDENLHQRTNSENEILDKKGYVNNFAFEHG